MSFWEYVYRGFGGGNRDGGFGGGGFGGSDPDSWTTSDDMKNDYNDFVSTLPATGYDSAGKLLWQPKWSDFKGALNSFSNYSDDGGPVFTGRSFPINYTSSKFDTAFVSDGTSLSVSLGSNVAKRTSLLLWLSNGTLDVPISGNYFLLTSDFIDGSYYSQNRSSLVVTPCLFSKDYSSQTIGYLAGGSSYKLPYSSFFPLAYVNSAPTIFNSSAFISGVYLHSGSFTVRTPVFAIEPISDTPTINNTYNINTRVNNFQGNYYNNVTNNYYNNTTIINETTNNYYDMTTNNYYTMSNWSYDYQSRTYFVTLEDGTTITVQFGDDCLTITNNNVENSYQYVINNNNTPSPNPETPSTCKHNWTETIDVAPTCLEGGHANFTCSLCGETYEQILSAKGHNWTVKEHVNTVYGENGVIVTQGHTLYECSACGEQWYTETATPPPDVSGGSSIRSWLQAFQLWLDGKLDSLFSAADAVIVTKLDALIEKTSDTVVNVIGDNTYVPGVLYLDDDNGVVNTTKNGVSIFGDLLRWLWQNVFDGAFEAADITKLDGLFYDPTEVTTDGS